MSHILKLDSHRTKVHERVDETRPFHVLTAGSLKRRFFNSYSTTGGQTRTCANLIFES